MLFVVIGLLSISLTLLTDCDTKPGCFICGRKTATFSPYYTLFTFIYVFLRVCDALNELDCKPEFVDDLGLNIWFIQFLLVMISL